MVFEHTGDYKWWYKGHIGYNSKQWKRAALWSEWFRLQKCLQLSRTILPLGDPQGSGSPRRRFPSKVEDLYSNSWMKIEVGSGCSALIQLHTGTVQGSVLSLLDFDLHLNALLRLLDATGLTHGIKRTPQWNHAAFADNLFVSDSAHVYVAFLTVHTYTCALSEKPTSCST